ncbi:MAG: DUF192 domain-containing protein [Alphaproteobacteria bacterium]|nr:DUF192 domain-containing protein [Alphaproteobacteria bacterium]
MDTRTVFGAAFKAGFWLVLFCIVTGVFSACTSAQERHSLLIRGQGGQENRFTVELALTPEEQQTGLMNRITLPDDGGMLFVFEISGNYNFWMKNTLIPLDMLFINEQGIIQHIHHNATPGSLEGISAGVPVKAVLELKGGQVQAYGIKEGDQVLYPARLQEGLQGFIIENLLATE